jgi:hypothetical protein
LLDPERSKKLLECSLMPPIERKEHVLTRVNTCLWTVSV